MPVIVRETDKSVLSLLSDILHSSIFGQCYPFAIALHRSLGWPLVGLMDNERIIHAGVKSPDGNIWDGRGEISEEDFMKPFAKGKNCIIHDIAEEDLFARSEIDKYTIDFFRGKAQVVWPDLPWKDGKQRDRVVAFVEELEALSRKHKLWICGPVPAMTPVMFEGYDDEIGYEINLTYDGNTYTINRVI